MVPLSPPGAPGDKSRLSDPGLVEEAYVKIFQMRFMGRPGAPGGHHPYHCNQLAGGYRMTPLAAPGAPGEKKSILNLKPHRGDIRTLRNFEADLDSRDARGYD